jgi:exopolyphosphatase / guanosine-5'-triphosphate,3'-diphosphate pyrophosphatase
VRFAAIDIGSNGARLLISRVLHPKLSKQKSLPTPLHTFKDIEYIRFALQLGKDVFRKQKIGKKKQTQLLKLMQVCKLMMELHEVDDYMAVATSAFREAGNGKELADWIAAEVGLHIEIIDGAREAEILNQVIIKELEAERNYIHIDVGGGSTELNLYVNQVKIAARSFEVGSIRRSNESEKAFLEIQGWIEYNLLEHTNGSEITAIGTGGNINKVQSLIQENSKIVTRNQIIRAVDYLNTFTYDEKVNLLELNPDRADTIVPATNIYLYVMDWANADTMVIPKLGLKDGMMEVMFQRQKEKKKTELNLV